MRVSGKHRLQYPVWQQQMALLGHSTFSLLCRCIQEESEVFQLDLSLGIKVLMGSTTGLSLPAKNQQYGASRT